MCYAVKENWLLEVRTFGVIHYVTLNIAIVFIVIAIVIAAVLFLLLIYYY